jgi:hypothetical protein
MSQRTKPQECLTEGGLEPPWRGNFPGSGKSCSQSIGPHTRVNPILGICTPGIVDAGSGDRFLLIPHPRSEWFETDGPI